ncbi:MAG TPA: 4Fe-4S binding protein [bacterium]|nr:4Fe-4S binding protein [bacterium]HPP86986.1 4Fe-4S binding protein [bacterium]
MKKDVDKILAISKPSIGEAGLTGGWRIEKPELDKTKCIAAVKNKIVCQLCWVYCPEAAIKRGAPPEINYDYCKGCGICAEECPNKAIKMIE